MKKICICTTFDRNYKEAGKTLFSSIRRHTNCEGIDFKVITADEEVLREFENCHFITEEIKKRYEDVKYIKDLPKEKYATSWYRYEMFNFEGYDRVICIDSDCICVKDISYLFSDELNDFDLISTEDMIVSQMFKSQIPQLEMHGLNMKGLSRRIQMGQIDIQPALLVANKKIVNNQWYKKLLNYANTTPHTYSIDEGILNDFIYLDGLNVKILPMEWNYMDTYGVHIPSLPVPKDPIIVHCQESKPFKKEKYTLDKRLYKWYDMWHEESKSVQKTIVAVLIWDRYENLQLWANAWKQCNTSGAELVIVHNQETNNERYLKLCKENGITYVPRENKGFDIGAFQDVCKERLNGFPNKWDNLIWFTDDCIPMAKDFIAEFLNKLNGNHIPCYEISHEIKTHVRTTGFLVTKQIANKLTFPKDPMGTRDDCWEFEHRSRTSLYEQLINMGKRPLMIVKDLKSSPVWDFGCRGHLNLMDRHKSIFTIKLNVMENDSVLDTLAIKYKADKGSRYHNYAVKYDKILSPYRETFTSVLEIGVAQGQSMQMWKDYFPNATIHGADINKASEICETYSNRIKFHLIDQSKESQLKTLEQYSPFDFIIDDGCHLWTEQILTFKTLFPYLKKGGIYICEDITTSYWKDYYNYEIIRTANPISAVEYFKTLVDDINLKNTKVVPPYNPPEEFGDWELGIHCREDCHTPLPLFDSIQFMNGFIVITKR